MPNFGETLKQYREHKHYTQEELAKLVGSSKQVVSRYEKGHRSPDVSIAQKWAEKLNIPIKFLVDDSLDIANYFSNPELPSNLIHLKRIKRIPILGKIACGAPILAEENIEGYIVLPDGVDANYALTCKGDSMIDAGINDGDTVFIKSQPDLENGEIGAVMVNEEATLKKVYKSKDVLTLAPANPSHEPLIFVKNEINQITILGKAVAFLRVLE